MNMLNPKYKNGAKDVVSTLANLQVRDASTFARKISESYGNGIAPVRISMTLQTDIYGSSIISIPSNISLELIGSGFKFEPILNVYGSLDASNVIFLNSVSGSGTAGFLRCEMADTAVTGNITNWSWTACDFGTQLTIGTTSNCFINGNMPSVESELLCGSLIGCTIELVGGVNSFGPQDCNINLSGDWTNTGSLGSGTNIIARNIPLPMGGGSALPPNGDYGDITVSGTGNVWTIDANVVSNTKLRDSVGLSVIGRASNTTGDPADIVAASGNTVLRRVGSTLGFGTIPQASVDNLVSDLQDRIIGPSSADDNAITRFDGPSGKYVQNSAVTLDDNGVLGWAGINAQLTTTKSAQLYADTDKNGLNLFEIYRQADLTLDLTHDGVFTVGRDVANVMLRSTLKTNKFGWADEATTYITHPSTLNQLHIVSDGSITSKFYGVQQLNLADDPTTPAYSFQGYEGFGMTLNGAGTSLSLVNAGETVATVDSDGLQVTSSAGVANVTGNALINQFNVGEALYSFYGDTDTGMLRWAADEIGWNCAGTTKMILTANELNVLGNVKRNSTSSTSDANFIVNAQNIALATWVASFTAARTLQVSNMIAGRSIKILMRNTNATARVITIQASATTSGYANVICTGNTAGAASVSTVSLAATSGTAVVEIFATAGGIFGRLG